MIPSFCCNEKQVKTLGNPLFLNIPYHLVTVCLQAGKRNFKFLCLCFIIQGL